MKKGHREFPVTLLHYWIRILCGLYWLLLLSANCLFYGVHHVRQESAGRIGIVVGPFGIERIRLSTLSVDSTLGSAAIIERARRELTRLHERLAEVG